jgi:hypothetical protein
VSCFVGLRGGSGLGAGVVTSKPSRWETSTLARKDGTSAAVVVLPLLTQTKLADINVWTKCENQASELK